MASGTDRMTRRMHRRWRASAFSGPPGFVTASDVAELQARVRRLQAACDRCDQVALSPDVVCRAAPVSAGRVGGQCVATEV